MPEQVTKLRVFVASPSDVRRERELLDGVIDELDRGIAAEKGLMLELVRWETHAWPDIGEDAQDVINRQIGHGDVFVGIMWNRFGTPTKRAESGTKEEFDRAYAYWKKYGRPKIMFYFNCAPFSPSSVDELEQKGKVLAFKKELGDKGALYWEYNGAHEFERVLRGHLTQVIRQWEPESGVPRQVGKEPTFLLAEYRAALIRKFKVLDLRQITWLGDLRLPLDSIYVRLQATGQLPPGDIPFDVETLKARGILSTAQATIRGETSQPANEQHPLPKPPPPPVPVEVALQHSRHLVALGEPGSGKTTLLHYLTLQFARQQARSNLGLETERLPIYLRLGDYAEALKSDPALSLPRFVVQTLAAAATSLPAQVVEEELREGRCVLLLDALDEVSSDLHRKVAEQIDDFFNSSDYSRNRVVATSRIAGYQTVRLQARSAETYTLRPFRRAEVETFARKWFQAVAEAQSLPDPDGEAERQTAAFLEQAQRPDVSRLLNTPLLLHLAVAVFTDRGTLPESRARLYSEYLAPVLSKRAKARTKVSPPCSSTQMRRALAKIAWHIHTQGRPVEEQLLEIIEDTVREADPDAVFDYLHQQLGLLADFGERYYDFTHLTFREYFLAHYLYDCWRKDPEATWQLLRPIRHRPEMREPILLLAGLLGYRANKRDTTELIRNIWHANDKKSDEWEQQVEAILRRDLLLAGWCLAEIEPGRIIKSLYQAYIEDLQESWEQVSYARLRDELMRVLGAVGDIELKTKVATALADHHLINREFTSYELDFATMSGLGYLGVVNDQIVRALLGPLPRYEKEVQSDRDSPGWVGRFAIAQEYEANPITKLQKAAIDSLGRLNVSTPEVINALVATLKLPGSTVREAAAEVLRKFSETNPQVIDMLIGILNEYVFVTRYFVSGLLVQMGETNPIVVDRLVSVLADQSYDLSMKMLVITSLGDLISGTKGHVDSEAFEALIDTLYDDSPYIREEAIKSLGKGLPAKDHSLTLEILYELAFALTDTYFQSIPRDEFLSDLTADLVIKYQIKNAIHSSLGNLIALEHQAQALVAAGHSEHPLGRLYLAGSRFIRGIIHVIVELLADYPPLREDEIAKVAKVNVLFLDEGYSRLTLREQVVANLTGVFAIPSPRTIDQSLQMLIGAWRTKFTKLVPSYLRQLDEVEKRHVLHGLSRALYNLHTGLHQSAVRDCIKMGEIAFSDEHFEGLLFSLACLFQQDKYQDGSSFENGNSLDAVISEWKLLERLPEKVVEKLLVTLEESSKSENRCVVIIKLLSRLREPTPEVIGSLTRFLANENRKCKSAAAEALGQLGCIAPSVIEALLDEENLVSANIWFSYAEPAFIRSLGKLARDYDEIDKVIEVLVLALHDPISGVVAAESLGALGHTTSEVIEALIRALTSRNEKVGSAATNSLIQLARMDQSSVIGALVTACQNVGVQSSPFGVSFVQRLRAETMGMASLFYPDYATDTHNYAYDALWAVVEDNPVEQ